DGHGDPLIGDRRFVEDQRQRDPTGCGEDEHGQYELLAGRHGSEFVQLITDEFTTAGIRSISGLNSTLTSRNHAMAIITIARGTPTTIHWPNPMEMSWLSLRIGRAHV